MNINTNNFPLYNILTDKINDNKITIEDKNKFLNFVKICDESQSEIIYTIIRIYELKNVKKSSSQIYNIPYKGISKEKENNEKDITFDFNLFPLNLQKMLIHFININ
jgi:hypothetical protein